MQNNDSFKRKKGRVIKCESNTFLVDFEDSQESCKARKNIKTKSSSKNPIIVGDYVNVSLVNNELIIDSVEKRQNSLIRPAIANVDLIVCVISPIPEPDYLLVDKMIINAHNQGIEVALCVNKVDLDSEFYKKVKSEYRAVVDAIIYSSAILSDIKQVKKLIKGNLTAFAGQSAVGKSSIINALSAYEQKVGELSKIGRGKNTTTKAELLKLDKNTYVIDTPGFSMLDIFDIDYKDIDLYYPEYVEAGHDCKYPRCQHINEPNCNVRELALKNKLSYNRYQRYLSIYNELKEADKRKY